MERGSPYIMSGPAETPLDKTRDDVAKQYEEWVYPLPLERLEDYYDNNFWDFADPQIANVDIWPAGHLPDGSYRPDLDILIAGCGANAAARFAHTNPKSRVTGIDLSEASLAHEKKLKEKYKLENLTLHQLPIEEVKSLGQEFDLIESSGVLHHLESPEQGLSALSSVLKPNGAIAVMLYGRYGRAGIYMLQQLFKDILGMDQSQASVEQIKTALQYLRPNHPGGSFLTSIDTRYDAGIVDLFLHPIDRGYTVQSCLDLATACNLTFQRWVEPFGYHPDGFIPQDAPVLKRLNALPEHELWTAMERYFSRIDKHSFYLTTQQRNPKSYQICFEGKDWLDYKPWRRIHKLIQPDPVNKTPAMIQRHPYHPIPIIDHQAILINASATKEEIHNNPKTIREIVKESGIKGKRQDVERYAQTFYHSMWKCGLMAFRIPHPDGEQNT